MVQEQQHLLQPTCVTFHRSYYIYICPALYKNYSRESKVNPKPSIISKNSAGGILQKFGMKIKMRKNLDPSNEKTAITNEEKSNAGQSGAHQF